MSVDDEVLMAFADGELPADRAAEVAAAVAANPGLAERVARFRAVRAQAAALREAAPAPRDDLMAAARQTPRPAARARVWIPSAVAAGLAVAVGAGVLIQRSDPFVGRGMDAKGVLAAALDRTASGEVLIHGPDVASPMYTVVVADGRACRGYRVARGRRASEGVACHAPGGWRVLADAPVKLEGGEFQQAGSVELPAVAGAVDALRPGDPLDAEAERVLIARGWTRK